MESFLHRRDQKFDSIIYYCFSRSFLVVLPWSLNPASLTTETPGKGVKDVVSLMPLLLTLSIFHTIF